MGTFFGAGDEIKDWRAFIDTATAGIAPVSPNSANIDLDPLPVGSITASITASVLGQIKYRDSTYFITNSSGGGSYRRYRVTYDARTGNPVMAQDTGPGTANDNSVTVYLNDDEIRTARRSMLNLVTGYLAGAPLGSEINLLDAIVYESNPPGAVARANTDRLNNLAAYASATGQAVSDFQAIEMDLKTHWDTMRAQYSAGMEDLQEKQAALQGLQQEIWRKKQAIATVHARGEAFYFYDENDPDAEPIENPVFTPLRAALAEAEQDYNDAQTEVNNAENYIANLRDTYTVGGNTRTRSLLELQTAYVTANTDSRNIQISHNCALYAQSLGGAGAYVGIDPAPDNGAPRTFPVNLVPTVGYSVGAIQTSGKIITATPPLSRVPFVASTLQRSFVQSRWQLLSLCPRRKGGGRYFFKANQRIISRLSVDAAVKDFSDKGVVDPQSNEEIPTSTNLGSPLPLFIRSPEKISGPALEDNYLRLTCPDESSRNYPMFEQRVLRATMQKKGFPGYTISNPGGPVNLYGVETASGVDPDGVPFTGRQKAKIVNYSEDISFSENVPCASAMLNGYPAAVGKAEAGDPVTLFNPYTGERSQISVVSQTETTRTYSNGLTLTLSEPITTQSIRDAVDLATTPNYPEVVATEVFYNPTFVEYDVSRTNPVAVNFLSRDETRYTRWRTWLQPRLFVGPGDGPLSGTPPTPAPITRDYLYTIRRYNMDTGEYSDEDKIFTIPSGGYSIQTDADGARVEMTAGPRELAILLSLEPDDNGILNLDYPLCYADLNQEDA